MTDADSMEKLIQHMQEAPSQKKDAVIDHASLDAMAEQMKEQLPVISHPDVNIPPDFISTERGERLRVQRILNRYFRDRTVCARSDFLEANPYMNDDSYNRYRDILPEYALSPADVKEYNSSNPDSQKFDCKDPNEAWKLHLNVRPEDIVSVSSYLQENGYLHKYLSGGELSDGKVFTIYVGSYDLVTKLAEEISSDLQEKLCRPGHHGEIELAAGVVGRFAGPKKEFGKYGTSGFSFLRSDASLYNNYVNTAIGSSNYQEQLEKLRTMAETKGYSRLLELYGDYFFHE